MGPELDPITAVVSVIVALITLVGVVWVTRIVVRAIEAGRSARAILERRLARGEIDPEEFFELESALRSSEPDRLRQRRLLRS